MCCICRIALNFSLCSTGHKQEFSTQNTSTFCRLANHAHISNTCHRSQLPDYTNKYVTLYSEFAVMFVVCGCRHKLPVKGKTGKWKSHSQKSAAENIAAGVLDKARHYIKILLIAASGEGHGVAVCWCQQARAHSKWRRLLVNSGRCCGGTLDKRML